MAQNMYYPYQSTSPLFPQPQGNTYIVNSSLEVANIPTGNALTTILCPQENLLYLKTVQNGAPVLQAYRLSPYNEPPKALMQQKEDSSAEKTKDELTDRVESLEKMILELKNTFAATQNSVGGKSNGNEKVWDV